MKAGADLAAWLADPEAQEAALGNVEQSAAKWSREPLMTQLHREVGAAEQPQPAELLAAACRFLDKTGDIDALLSEMIALCREKPFFRPPFHATFGEIHTGLMLYHHPLMTITLGVTGVEMLAAKKAGKRGAGSIAFTGLTTLFRYVKAGNATVSFWEAPPITGDFVGAEAGKARFVERRRIEDGEEIVIDGSRQSFIIEHAESDMVYFQAMLRSGAPLAVEYDSRSLSFVGASSADEVSSRIQMMATLLRTMERQDAVPLIREFLGHPHFYLRWHLMRELLAMDAEASLPDLRRMAAADPHPEVRAAARQTLRLFFDEEPADAGEGEIQCRA